MGVTLNTVLSDWKFLFTISLICFVAVETSIIVYRGRTILARKYCFEPAVIIPIVFDPLIEKVSMAVKMTQYYPRFRKVSAPAGTLFRKIR